MTEAIATPRIVQKECVTVPAARTFWASAQRVADLAAVVADAPRSLLVEAGAKFHGHAVQPHELAADLASLNEKIQIICQRLGESGDPLIPKPQRENARQNMAAMVREGALVSPTAFAETLNFTRQALSKALKANRVFYVEVAGERYYPAFFLNPLYRRRPVECVSQMLGNLPGPSKLQFFLNRKGSLKGLTPLEALSKGEYAQACIAAEGFADR